MLLDRARWLTEEAARRVAGPIASVGAGRECPLCGWTGSRFLRHGRGPARRREAFCPGCRSLERHRLVALIADQIGDGHTTMHVAPEPAITDLLRRRSSEYISVDLRPGVAMVQADLTELREFDDDSFSLVFCSHVLEHIPDDRAAMREMRRVLRPGGRLVVMVPLRGELTDEDSTVVTPADRMRRYHNPGHVRYYGADIVDRLQSAGFRIERISTESLPPEVRWRHGLASCEDVFLGF